MLNVTIGKKKLNRCPESQQHFVSDPNFFPSSLKSQTTTKLTGPTIAPRGENVTTPGRYDPKTKDISKCDRHM